MPIFWIDTDAAKLAAHEADTTDVHGIADAGNLLDVGDVGVSVAAEGHQHTLSDVTDAGTSAALNVPATGDAAAGEVVKGDDSRLADSRSPLAHNHDGDYEPLGAIATHDAETAVHGIADTANLLEAADIGVSVQAHDADTAKTDTRQDWTKQQNYTGGDLTFSAAVEWNLDDKPYTRLVVTGGTTISLAAGTIHPLADCKLELEWDGVGGHAVAFAANIHWFDGDTPPTFSLAAGSRYQLMFSADADGVELWGLAKELA